MDQGVATLTGASIVRSADSSPIPDQEVVCTADHAPADLLMYCPDITCVERVDDSVMQISETGHWFLKDGSVTTRWIFWLTRDRR